MTASDQNKAIVDMITRVYDSLICKLVSPLLKHCFTRSALLDQEFVGISLNDVRVTFLLQVSMVLTVFFLIWSNKLTGSPLCRFSMKLVLAA